MEEALLDPKFWPGMLNVLWDNLMATKQKAKQLAGNILMTKSVSLQTEYMAPERQG